MARRRRNAERDLHRLATYFSRELTMRAWGDDEYRKLTRGLRDSSTRDRALARHVLAALDRVTSIQVAADAGVQIVAEAAQPARPIPTTVLLEVVAVLRDQASHAVADAFSAVRAAERSPTRFDRSIRRVPLRKAAAILGTFQPEPSDLVVLLPTRLTPVERSLRESMMACWFVERAVESVEQLVAAKARVGIAPATASNLFRFLMNTAAFARDVITVRVAGALERKPTKRAQAPRASARRTQ